MVTSDDVLADDLRGLRAHGWVRDRSDSKEWTLANPGLDPRSLFATVGYNVRPTEIQAAIGSVQLRRLNEMLIAREALARAVQGWLGESAPWLELIGGDCLHDGPPLRHRARTNSWMTLPLRLLSSAPIDRNRVVDRLEECGVETRPIIAGNLARHPAVRQVPHRSSVPMPVSDALLRETFMIGCHPVLSPGSLATLERALTGLRDL